MMTRQRVIGIGIVCLATWLSTSATLGAQTPPKPSVPAPSVDPEVRQRKKEFLLDEAMMFVQQRDWDNAIRSLEDALVNVPDDEDLQLWLRRAKGERAKAWMIEDVRIEGDVALNTANGRRYPGRAMIHVAVDNRSRITAGPASRLTMLLPDGTTFAFAGADSGGEITLDGFVYQPDSDRLTYLLEFSKGNLRYVTGNSSRPRLPPFSPNPPRPQSLVHYAPEVRIPIGYLRLLGTDVECNISADGTGVVTVNEGPVAFREKGATVVRTLTAGQSIRFDRNRVIEIR